ncbi:MAG: hypothetical protein PSV23_16530 [Brevundimonas sp.]|uniref:hypothetical protein n=1 Tax=Brevundimonas sp. TaxID=1871086 RepID=UPI0024881B4A|nr:hypothetical protein [Brevundimonas sp.]MDI1328398.1 hypothetical protein [Brevundimonas sp.]
MNSTSSFAVIKALVETCSEIQGGGQPNLAHKLAPALAQAEAYGWHQDVDQLKELIAAQPS